MNFDYLWDIGDIILRAFISICFLFIITRLMGKKQISQLTFFDYVIGISLGSIAAAMASSTDVPYEHTLTSMTVYTVIALTISIVTNKSMWARRFFTGKTFLLIDKGKILEENLNKVKYDINDLLAQARNAGYFNIADVHYALLETNGKISFMPVSDKQPTTVSDLNIVKPQDRLTANVIIDGVIIANNLKAVGLNNDWLKSNLEKQHINPIQDIILATVDTDNNLSVYLKSKKVIKTTPID
ncbi:MAG: DUF421 domain-containing protein [Oscillospiraceae bacterium]